MRVIDINRAQILELYEKYHVSQEDIARRYGISKLTVRDIIVDQRRLREEQLSAE